MKIATLVLAGLLGMVGTASADDEDGGEALHPPSGPVRLEQVRDSPGMRGPGAGMRKQKRQLPPGVVERFDRDGDGRLDPQERKHAIRALRRVVRRLAQEQRAEAGAVRGAIRRFDTNGDGIVDPGEAPPNLKRRMRHLDRNRDGWVDGADR
jgi:hypothetical protein